MPGITPIVSILRAAHCRSTHHYFAVDALPMVQTQAGRRLARILVRHHHRYLTGAIDPDIRFRDYQNHVVHATDGYWGGAPRVAHQWYDRLQRYLRTNRYSDAAHAAGVLSHYFTDPMQPLHTQHCQRERILHLPIEWSITRSYQQIFQGWKNDDLRIVFQLSDGPGWLGEAILHGARFANRKYDQLINEYDLVSGSEKPSDGLNDELRGSIAEMFGLAITGWARVLERAASDSEQIRACKLPRVGLSLATILATVRSPMQLSSRWMWYGQQQHAVDRLVDEFRRTRTLRESLPAEVNIVHRVCEIHAQEQQWREERMRRLASTSTVVGVETNASDTEAPSNAPATIPFRPRQRASRQQPTRRSA